MTYEILEMCPIARAEVATSWLAGVRADRKDTKRKLRDLRQRVKSFLRQRDDAEKNARSARDEMRALREDFASRNGVPFDRRTKRT